MTDINSIPFQKKLIPAMPHCFLKLTLLLSLTFLILCSNPDSSEDAIENKEYTVTGSVTRSISNVDCIETIVFDNDNIEAESLIVTLWLNTKTLSYNGSIELPVSAKKHNYSLYVRVYNSDSLLTGRSEDIAFTNSASLPGHGGSLPMK